MVGLFKTQNFPLPAAPPGYFVSGNRQNPSTGSTVPAGFSTWVLSIDTTGLPTDQPLADIVVQYHYTNAQLGVTGMPNQGAVTNSDGTITEIDGGAFTGWIDDCATSFRTSFINKFGQVQRLVTLGCDLKRIVGFYPDRARFLVLSTPGYVNISGASLDLN